MAPTISQIFRSRNRVHGKKSQETNDPRILPVFFFFFSWPQTSRWELFKYSKAVPILPALFTTLTRSLHWNKSNSGEIRFVYRLDPPPFAGSHGDEPSPSLPSIQFNLTSAIKSIGQRPLCEVNLIIFEVELDSAFLSDATENPLTKIKMFEC